MSVETLLAKANEGIHAGRSFGPVIEGDGCLLVPVAFTVGGGGGGDAEGESGPSSGGGFGMVSYPLGVYVVRDGTARWVPSFDVTLLTMAALGVVRAILRIRKRR